MNDFFILGAGFSKAVSNKMPIVKGAELSKEVLKRCEIKSAIPAEIQHMIEENFESALSFLASNKPWFSESENQRHRTIYLELTESIRRIFWCKSKDLEAWNVTIPPHWLEELIAYWHNNRCAVITLNYDTLIECVASKIYSKKRPVIPTGDLYPIQFTEATQTNDFIQTASREIKNPMETFRLFKLHGSINWFYSGRSNFLGEELFYVPCVAGIDGVFDGADNKNTDWHRLNEKCPLIVPPTLDKSGFFQHEVLRSMWFQAGETIKRANRVICLGYSLPESDLTIAHFLKSCASPNRIRFEIVDLAERDNYESKVERFSRIIGKESYEYHQEYSGGCCILKFILKELINDSIDKHWLASEISQCMKEEQHNRTRL